jgi:hypothetical protein
MKKIFFACLTGFFLASSITSISYSQTSNTIAQLSPQPSSEKNIYLSDAALYLNHAVSNDLTTTEISKKIITKFTRNYGIRPEARWFKSSTGLFVAFFAIDNIKTFIYYNVKGGCEYIMRYYEEEKLPREILQWMKNAYEDFSIDQVTEVRKDDKIAYVIKMENRTSWKTVKIVDGEMEVIEEYLKGRK